MPRMGPHHGFVALLVLAALALGAALLREEVAGRAAVVDGDTLDLSGRRIRLRGMDAPEMAQICREAGRDVACGEVARDALRAIIAGRDIACEISGRDRYRRALARCRVDGQDVGRTMVRRGLAVAYGDYLAEEAAARAERLGLWSGIFERPSAFRRRHAQTPDRS